MARKGLTREVVMKAAEDLIKMRGYESFSINELARYLDVKPASLYNHVKSAEEIYTEVGLRAINGMSTAMNNAMIGKTKDDAIRALAISYRDYAHNNPGLYKVIMALPMIRDRVLNEAVPELMRPIMEALSVYKLTEKQAVHWQRILRSVMHGFVSQEESGYFKNPAANVDESYLLGVDSVILGIHRSQSEQCAENEKCQYAILKGVNAANV
jgi:AcrR family transcriptional regulator